MLTSTMRRKSPSRSGLRVLPFPASAQSRTIQLAEWSDFPGVPAVPIQRWRELQGLQPDVLCGSTANLLWLTTRIFSGELQLPSLKTGLFASARAGESLLDSQARALLWRAFQVPVFTIYQSDAGDILAFECAAHDSWHVATGAEFFQAGDQFCVRVGNLEWACGFNASLRREKCACGKVADLLSLQEPVRSRQVFAAAS